MIRYFDIVYIRTYRQYLKWGEKDIPKLTAVLVLSLFQSLNVISLYIIIRNLLEGNQWTLFKWHIIAIMITVASLDYLWIFRLRNFDELNEKYDRLSRGKIVLHPIIYFIISIGILFVLKEVNMFPNVK